MTRLELSLLSRLISCSVLFPSSLKRISTSHDVQSAWMTAAEDELSQQLWCWQDPFWLRFDVPLSSRIEDSLYQLVEAGKHELSCRLSCSVKPTGNHTTLNWKGKKGKGTNEEERGKQDAVESSGAEQEQEVKAEGSRRFPRSGSTLQV